MKNLLNSLMVAGAFTGGVIAQSQETGDKEKMKIFADWVRHWSGESTIRMGQGEPQKSMVDEHIESKLDGMVLMMEGTGKTTDPATQKESIVHHALGILSFDKGSGQYKFRTYLHDGRSTEAWFKNLSDNKYQWGFDIPQGQVRYNIVLDPAKKSWHETGEYSSDGSTWHEFLEMNLTKVD